MSNQPDPQSESRTTAFVELLSQHEQRVKGYLLSLVPNWADMEDLYAETNLRLWQQFDEFEPGTDFGAWSCSVAYYMVLEYRKKRTRSRVIFSDDLLASIGQQAIEATQATSEHYTALVNCVGKMSQANRELLMQCYSGQTSIKRVAQQLGRSASSVYVSLARLRRRLGECVDRQLKEGVGQ